MSSASRVFIVYGGHRALAYYALASAAVAVEATPGRLKQNMPDKIFADASSIFYERIGFCPSPLDPMMLMVALADLQDALGSSAFRPADGLVGYKNQLVSLFDTDWFRLMQRGTRGT